MEAAAGGECPYVVACWLATYACSRTADAYKVGTSLTDDGVLASDHRPVFADVTI